MREIALNTFHLAAKREESWHDYARQVVANASALGMTLRLTPEAIRLRRHGGPPPALVSPRNSLLDCRKLELILELELPDWRQDVYRVIRRLRFDGGIATPIPNVPSVLAR